MTYRRLIWKNAFRNKLRTLLTVAVIALALFGLTVVFTFANQFYRNLDETSALRMIVRHKVSLAEDLPERYGPLIKNVPGVVAMSQLNWFGGHYIDAAHTDFAQFSCTPETFFDVYTEISIPNDQKEAFKKERTATVVGRSKAQKHGWKLGDRITIKGVIYPVDLELTVRGIYSGTLNQESAIYFHRDYVEEALGRPGRVGTYWILVDSADSVERVSQTIDSTFKYTDAPTKTETEREFQLQFISMLGNLTLLVVGISSVIVFTILLVTGNTMAMSIRERIREIAVMKALGFRRWKLLLLLLSEGALVSLTGGVIGCGLAWLMLLGLDPATMTQGFLQQLDVTPDVIGAGLAIAVAIGLMSAGIPALRVSMVTVSEGLRHVG
jgi:putative ABC transport system permease protein